MFAICGARGDISMTPDGPPVNYDDILLEDSANLYYTPSGNFPSIFEVIAHLGLPTFVFSRRLSLRGLRGTE